MKCLGSANVLGGTQTVGETPLPVRANSADVVSARPTCTCILSARLTRLGLRTVRYSQQTLTYFDGRVWQWGTSSAKFHKVRKLWSAEIPCSRLHEILLNLKLSFEADHFGLPYYQTKASIFHGGISLIDQKLLNILYLMQQDCGFEEETKEFIAVLWKEYISFKTYCNSRVIATYILLKPGISALQQWITLSWWREGENPEAETGHPITSLGHGVPPHVATVICRTLVYQIRNTFNVIRFGCRNCVVPDRQPLILGLLHGRVKTLRPCVGVLGGRSRGANHN